MPSAREQTRRLAGDAGGGVRQTAPASAVAREQRCKRPSRFNLFLCAPLSIHPHPHQQAPIAALAAFGAYALALLLIGIASFKDCPDDAAALQKVRPRRGKLFNICAFSIRAPCLVSLSQKKKKKTQDIAAARADLVARGVLDASG